jgi:exodeoxyribonuclease VII small subunit
LAKKTDADSRSTDESTSFEDELARLEAIVRQLEEGQIGLGESLDRYEEGVKHLKRCYQLLDRAEQKVELLLNADSEGNERTEPFLEDAMSLEEKAQRRSRRRSRPAAKDRNAGASPASGDVDVRGGLF